jgi:uncharacterized protein (TIGR00297 family)
MIVNHPMQSLQLQSRKRRVSRNSQPATRLRWQSQLPLFVAIASGTATIALQCIAFSSGSSAVIFLAFALGATLAFLTWKLRAATVAAALAGGLVTTALYLATPGYRTALWPLFALLLLTLAATHFGRARKEKLDIAESRRGRTASQVAANLGAAVLATLPIGLSRYLPPAGLFGSRAMRIALAAALAEAAADTLSSELGEVLGGEPYLLTSFRCVPAGTDGAISLAGTLAGCTGALIVTLVVSLVLDFTPAQGGIVALAAIVGLFVDSLLGALLERKGWLNNDAVNFLSTLSSALVAAALASR